MSQRHRHAFDGVVREHRDLLAMVQTYEGEARRGLKGHPEFDAKRTANVIASAADAYALLLIANAEGFMREHLESISVPLGARPDLSSLIDRCRKEWNARNPSSRIRAIDAEDVHELRRSRNTYAHGRGTSVFPSVPRVAALLAKFFDPIP